MYYFAAGRRQQEDPMIYETILITGCGGDIAMALAKIARSSGVAHRLIGCDIHGNHPGTRLFEVCEITSRADSPDYVAKLRETVEKYKVDAIVPMSEAELRRLTSEGCLSEFSGKPVIAANGRALEIGLDKFETFRMLKKERLPAPWTCIVGEERPKQLPCVIKQRRGQGSKGLLTVIPEMVERLTAERAGDLWQELILPEDQEYTCGLYRCSDGETRTLILRRRLLGGLTSAAEVVADDAIDALLRRIAVALDLSGSINVQLRIDAEGPKVFEINPRFSSTVGFRHRLGFRDFIWSLLERRELRIESYCPPKPGTKLFRGAREYVIG
jgi:carbamoyl-phosphate synthase large subunit